MANRSGSGAGESRNRAVKLSDLLAADRPEDAPLPLPRRRPDLPGGIGEADEIDGDDGSDEVGAAERAGKPDGAKSDEKSAKSRAKSRPTAYAAALRILAAGDNSVRMLREKLIRKGYSPSEIAGALDALIDQRYLDDARLMERYAAALAEKKSYGAYRIAQEIRRRFDRDSVTAHLAESLSPIDFAAHAANFAQKHADSPRESLIRRMRALGYTGTEIRGALETLSEDIT